MWVIASQAGGGKTSLALQIARNIADNPDKHVLFISLEMTKEELAGRMFCEMNGIDYGKLRRGEPIAGWKDIDDRFEEYLQHINLDVVDDRGYNFTEVRDVINERYGSYKPDIIFLDYLQLISTAGNKDERGALDEFLRGMVEKCKKSNIALVIMSQLRRPPTGVSVNKAPENVDLKGSGKIEQDAFVVIFCYRQVGMKAGVYENKMYMKVSKNRDGATDEKEFDFIGHCFRWEEKLWT